MASSSNNIKFSMSREVGVNEMTKDEKKLARKHLLEEADKYKCEIHSMNGHKGMKVARDNARSHKLERERFEGEVVPALREELDILENRIRLLTEENSDNRGNMYALELKNKNLRDDNLSLRFDLNKLRDMNSNICKDLHDTVLENISIASKDKKLEELVLSCTCKSDTDYVSNYLLPDSYGEDVIDSE